MKRLLSACSFAALVSVTFAQTKPHEVVLVDSVAGVSAAQLYQRAKLWFIDFYKSAPDVIQLDDSAKKTIVGKGVMEWVPTVFRGSDIRKGYVRYTVEVSCKEGRYRVRLYNYIHEGSQFYSAQFGRTVGPDSYGMLYDGRPCFTLNPGVEFTKFHERLCTEEFEPGVRLSDEQLMTSLRKAMRVPVASASDW